MRNINRKPVAAAVKYDNRELWYLEIHGYPVDNWSKSGHNWDTCPGTLYQDYSTKHAALSVALWWGYQVVEAEKIHQYRNVKLLELILLCIAIGIFVYTCMNVL